jgi:UDP-GlcNAc3NAcA epimerase
MKKIITIIGARPQFIKHAALQAHLKVNYLSKTIHTGQHYDENMSNIFFDQLEMPTPDYILDLKGAKTQGAQTGIMMAEIESVIMIERPDAIIVYGDTNSTLAGALVASKSHIPLIHIEAGLRSFNRDMPEEINRIVADEFSYLLLCPTQQAIKNLAKEGISHDRIFLTGDLMCDMLLMAQSRVPRIQSQNYLFATIHRPYNTDNSNRLKLLLEQLNSLNAVVCLAIHPRTMGKMISFGLSTSSYQNIHFLPPLGYFESISYQKYSMAVITDSGGVQKEAYMLKKKCITVRPETEWEETLVGNWNMLIFDELQKMGQYLQVEPDSSFYNPAMYGDGLAGRQIVEIISNHI